MGPPVDGEPGGSDMAYEINGMEFSADTTRAVARILEGACTGEPRQRLEAQYGNWVTGASWAEPPFRFYVGRSTGRKKIPLEIKRRDSSGGAALLVKNIVRLSEVGPRGRLGKVLWRHPLGG